MDPGNPYEEDEEESEDVGQEENMDIAEGDGGATSAVVGTGSGEIEGCDDGGAEMQTGDAPDLSVSKYLYAHGKKLLFEGDLKSAKILFEQCHTHRQRTFGNNEVAIFALLYIAEVDFRMGNYKESDQIFHQCIDEFTAVCGAKCLQVAEALHRIGLNYHVLGNFKAALENLNNAMQIRKQLLSPSSKDLATSLHCIGLIKLDLHILDDAQTLFSKSFQIRKQKFGEQHLDVVESFISKALLFERQARYSEALNSLVSANSVRENVIGETVVSSLTADCLLIRSRIQMHLGNYEIALTYCANAFDIYTGLLGAAHPKVWSALHQKAELWYRVGNVIDSKILFEDLLKKRVALFGDNHTSVADSLFGVAQNMRELAQYAAAEEIYKSAMSVMQIEYPERHPKILSCQFGIAECYRSLGETQKAKGLHDRVKRNRQDMLGKQHPDFLACLQVAVDFKIRVDGEQVDAENLLKVLIQSKRKILGDEHPDTADALNSLGEFLRLNHRYGEANVAFDEALFIKLKTVGDKHPRTIEIVNNMALRNATFRVKNIALEKQKTLLAQSQTFAKEEAERLKSQESGQEDNPFQSFDETTSPSFQVSEPLNIALNVRKIDAEGLLQGNNSPYIKLSINGINWERRTEVLHDRGSEASWLYPEGSDNQMVIEGSVDEFGSAVMSVSAMDDSTDKQIGDCVIDMKGAIPADNSTEEVVLSCCLVCNGEEVGNVNFTFGVRFRNTAHRDESSNPQETTEEGAPSEEEGADSMERNMSMSRIPVFDNSDFKKSVEDLMGCVRLLDKVFLSTEKYGAENSGVHPLVANLKGNIGVVEKLEAEAKEQFTERLSKEERRMFLAAEEAVKLRDFENNEDEIVFEPGQKAIHEAIMYLEHFPFVETHYWREKFKKLAEKGTDTGDDTVRVAEAMLAKAITNMQRNLVSNAYNEYEESNKVLTTDPRKAAQGHMLVAIAQQGMAKCLSYMCKFDEAKVLYESSVAMQRKLCPDDDEMVAGILFDLAEAQRQCGSYGDAIKTMVESLEVRRHLRLKADRTSSQPSVVELQSMLAVANLHLEAEQYIDGMQLCNEVVEVAKSYSFPIPLELANAYVVQAKLFIQLARYAQAYSAVDKAQALRRKAHGKKDHLDIAECFQIKSSLLILHKADNMNALRLSSMALLMRKRCIIASLTVLDDYEIAAKMAATYEEKCAEEDAAEAGVIGDDGVEQVETVANVEQKTDVAENDTNVDITTESALAAESKAVERDTRPVIPMELQKPPADDPSQPFPEHSLIVESLVWKGRCQFEMGKFSAAMELFEQAFDMNNIIFGADHFVSGTIQFYMAETAHAIASFKMAHSLYLSARDAMLRQYGEKSMHTIEANCGLASNYRAVSKFSDALELLLSLYPTAIEVLTESHPLVGRACYAIAECFLDLGNFEKSKLFFDRALSIRQGTLLENNSAHPLVAISYFGLGECFRVGGFYTEAGVQYDKASLMIGMKYGDSHPTTARIVHGLSTHRRVIGQYLSAKVTFEAAMVARRDTFGKNHIITADSLIGIGYNSFDQGMFKAAQPYFQKALQVITDRLLPEIYDSSPHHALMADVFYGCAENARALGEYAKAEDFYQKAFEQRCALYGEDHFLTQMAHCGLADVYRLTERWEDATKLTKSVLGKLQEALGEEDKRVAKVMLYAGRVLECKGEYPLAKGLHERAFAMLGRIFGSNHSETARSLFSLANVSRILGKLDISKAQQDVALRSRKNAFSGQQADIALSYAGMGDTYLAMGLFDMSYILFLKAICIQKPQLGDKHPELYHSLMGLAETLRALGRVCDNKTVIKEHEELYGSEYMYEGEEAEQLNRKLEPVGPEVPPEVRQLEEQCGFQLDAYAIYMAALQSASKCLGPSSLSVAAASLGIAKCLCDMSRFREASVLCRDVLKMQRRLVGDGHAIIISTLAWQAKILLKWGRLYPVEEVPVFNPEIAEESAHTLRQQSTADLSLGWAVHSTRSLSQAKGGFTWKHGYCNREKPGVPGGYMGYRYPTRPVVKRESVFDDNLIVKEHPINTIDEFLKSRDINDPYSISVEDDKFLEYISEPLTGDCEKLIEVGLELAHKKYPPSGEHPDTAVLLQLKGELFKARGVRAIAKKAFALALSMRQRMLAPGHPAIAEIVYDIAENSLSSGDVENATLNFEKSLLFRERTFGRNHVCIAENLLGMASVFLSVGKVAEAKDVAMEALALRVKWLSKGHYLVATASQVLGSILLATGSSLEEARIMFKNAIDIKIKTFGQYHYEVCSCCNDYALVLLKLNRYSDALEIFQDAYKVQRRLFGDLHPDIATTIHNQASVLLEMGDLESAEKLYLESLAMKRELFGFEHPLVATALHNIAGLYQLMEKLDSAYKLYMEALSIRINTFGEIHESVAETENNLGLLSYAQSRFSDAIDEFERALAIKRRIYDKGHISLAGTLNNLATVYYSIQDFTEAETLYAECLLIREASLGADHPDTHSCRECLEKLGKIKSQVIPGGQLSMMTTTSKGPISGGGGLATLHEGGNKETNNDIFNKTI